MVLPPAMVVTLIHIQGGMKGEIQEFPERVITIGRHPSLSLHFPAEEPGVSRNHAQIEREGNQFRLTDSSKFGTFINGKQVREAYLKNGDVLEFGPGGPKVSFHAEIVEGSFVAPAASAAPAPYPAPEPEPAVQSVPKPAPPVAPPFAAQPVPPPPVAPPPSRPAQQPEKAKAPLVIQYGPVIRSFSELPVTIGSAASADFLLPYPGISGQHLQLLYFRNAYWVKDLAGVGIVTVNREKVTAEVELKPFDEIECSPGGPVFRFIGEGRLVEVEREPVVPAATASSAPSGESAPETEGGGFFAKVFKGFKR